MEKLVVKEKRVGEGRGKSWLWIDLIRMQRSGERNSFVWTFDAAHGSFAELSL